MHQLHPDTTHTHAHMRTRPRTRASVQPHKHVHTDPRNAHTIETSSSTSTRAARQRATASALRRSCARSVGTAASPSPTPAQWCSVVPPMWQAAIPATRAWAWGRTAACWPSRPGARQHYTCSGAQGHACVMTAALCFRSVDHLLGPACTTTSTGASQCGRHQAWVWSRVFL